MRVLIIDDEEDTRSVFSMSLGLLGGVDVIEAQSGAEGVEKAAVENPDVIILDLLMPEMDGTQTFLSLKARPETEKIPVIFMTVKGMFSEFDELKSMGALAVIAKPFDPTTLTERIKSILNANGYQHVTGNGDAQPSKINESSQKAEGASLTSEIFAAPCESSQVGLVSIPVSDGKGESDNGLGPGVEPPVRGNLLRSSVIASKRACSGSVSGSVRPQSVAQRIYAKNRSLGLKGKRKF